MDACQDGAQRRGNLGAARSKRDPSSKCSSIFAATLKLKGTVAQQQELIEAQQATAAQQQKQSKL
jgi:hypothetical protein